MKALIFGASGMVGTEVLHQTLDDERIEKVTSCTPSGPFGQLSARVKRRIRHQGGLLVARINHEGQLRVVSALHIER